MREGLEVLTLLQTGKRDMAPVVMLDEPGGNYWRHLDDFIRSTLLERQLISAEDCSLYKLTNSVDEAVAEVLGFYRIYHSMRYVKHRLALRLKQAPSPELVAELNAQFADILVDGSITASGPLSEERDEPELAHLPRLVLHFNRRNLGRLREMIDVVNRSAQTTAPLVPAPPPPLDSTTAMLDGAVFDDDVEG